MRLRLELQLRNVLMGQSLKTSLTGGESVYCINEAQLVKAKSLAEGEGEESERVREALARLENDYSRNERAAIAFVLIERLLSRTE